MEEMTKEEMQRFLNREAEKGSSEYEALRALADILGIAFPELKKNQEDENWKFKRWYIWLKN